MNYDVGTWIRNVQGKRISALSMELYQSADDQVSRCISLVIEIENQAYRIAVASDGETIGIDDICPEAQDLGKYGSTVIVKNPCAAHLRDLVGCTISAAEEIRYDSLAIGISIFGRRPMELHAINYNDELFITNQFEEINDLLAHFDDAP